MAEHVWSVLTSSSTIDRETQILSLFNILEYLNIAESAEKLREVVEARAAFAVQMELWSWWVRSDYAQPETAVVRYRLIAADGERFPPKAFQVPLEETRTAHTRLRVNTFPFRGLGLYWWIVEKKGAGDSEEWELMARVPIELAHQEPTSSPTAPEPPSEPTPDVPRNSS
ncbi:MAG TPA: hypothetical protein VHR45_07095 [Thermoanaerobaculia bacterium]|nr:hypothetical protein [Thermoanaerobaculia bacterium]